MDLLDVVVRCKLDDMLQWLFVPALVAFIAC